MVYQETRQTTNPNFSLLFPPMSPLLTNGLEQPLAQWITPEGKPEPNIDPQTFWQNLFSDRMPVLPVLSKAQGPVSHEHLTQAILYANDQLPTPKQLTASWKAYQESLEPETKAIRIIAIFGPPGCGKTQTAISITEANPNAILVEEEWTGNYEENLKPFYELLPSILGGNATPDQTTRMHQASYKGQVWFACNTSRRMHKAIRLSREGKLPIVDVPLLGDAAYTLSHAMLGLASPKDFFAYLQTVKLLQKTLPPIKITYLYNGVRSADTLMHRINTQRGRPMEQFIPKIYLEVLLQNFAYLAEFFRRKGVDIHVFDSETINFSPENSNRSNLAQELLTQISQ